MYNAIQLVNARQGDVIRPPLINTYSALSMTPYWCGVNFLVDNLSSFPHYVSLNGVKVPHRLDKLFKLRPNPQVSPLIFRSRLYFHAIHTGNGFAMRDTPAYDDWYNIPPEHITPFKVIDDIERPYAGTIWYYYAPTKKVVAAADVLHIRGLGHDELSGYDPTLLLNDTFVQAASIQRYQTRYIQKGTVIRGQINIPKGVVKEKAEEIVTTVRRFFHGPDADRDVIVLSDGAVLSNATLTPEQSQLIEWDQEITKKFAQILRVQPRYLYEYSQQKYVANAEQDGQEVVRYTFRPRMDVNEDELTHKLLTTAEIEQGYRVCLDPSALQRGDDDGITANAVALKAAGIIDANEARAQLRLPARDDPSASELKTSGDTSPQPPAEKTTENPTEDKADKTEGEPKETGANFSAVMPLLDAACERVEVKASKILADKKNPDTPWVNVFAEQQQKYARQELLPVVSAITALGGEAVDVDAVAARYAGEIRRRAKGIESRSLKELVYGKE